MNTELKYKPKSLQEFVFANSYLERKVKQYASGTNCRHVILQGPFGTGKSLLADLIPKAIDGPNVAVKKFVAEDLNTAAQVKARLSAPMTFYKNFSPAGQSRFYTLIEEVNFTANAKGALRVIFDELYGHEQLFVTTNEPNKIDQALLSRAEVIEVPPIAPNVFFARAQDILKAEGVSVDDRLLFDLLEKSIKVEYDNRKYYKVLDELIFDITGK